MYKKDLSRYIDFKNINHKVEFYNAHKKSDLPSVIHLGKAASLINQ